MRNKMTMTGCLMLGGMMLIGSGSAMGQAANIVTLTGTTNASCTYSSISIQPNGIVNVTCGSGAVSPPAAPIIGTATPLNASISLAFTPPGGSVTGYTATCNPGGVTASGSSSPILVSGLTNDTLYTCSVAASNSGGTGASSAPVTATPTAGAVAVPPGAPTIGAGTPGDTTATIAFTAPISNGGAPITAYTASCTGGGETKTQSGPASPLTVSGLVNGTAYACSVVAANSAGSGDVSGTVNVTPAPPTVPGAPTIGTVTAGNGSASVAFTAPASNGGSPITSYTASCTPAGGGAAVTGTGAGSPITVNGLTNGTTYTCSVQAINAQGTSDASGTGSVTPVAGCVTPANTTLGAFKTDLTGKIYNKSDTGTVGDGKAKAFPFKLDPAYYANGIRFSFESSFEAGGYNSKDIAISACPGDFAVASACLMPGVTIDRLTASTSPSLAYCNVEHGKTYYLNVRPAVAGKNAAAVVSISPR